MSLGRARDASDRIQVVTAMLAMLFQNLPLRWIRLAAAAGFAATGVWVRLAG